MSANLGNGDVNRIHTRLDAMIQKMGEMNTEIARIHSTPCPDLRLVTQRQEDHRKEHETQKLEVQAVRHIGLKGIVTIVSALIVGLGGVVWGLIKSGAFSQ